MPSPWRGRCGPPDHHPRVQPPPGRSTRGSVHSQGVRREPAICRRLRFAGDPRRPRFGRPGAGARGIDIREGRPAGAGPHGGSGLVGGALQPSPDRSPRRLHEHLDRNGDDGFVRGRVLAPGAPRRARPEVQTPLTATSSRREGVRPAGVRSRGRRAEASPKSWTRYLAFRPAIPTPICRPSDRTSSMATVPPRAHSYRSSRLVSGAAPGPTPPGPPRSSRPSPGPPSTPPPGSGSPRASAPPPNPPAPTRAAAGRSSRKTSQPAGAPNTAPSGPAAPHGGRPRPAIAKPAAMQIPPNATAVAPSARACPTEGHAPDRSVATVRCRHPSGSSLLPPHASRQLHPAPRPTSRALGGELLRHGGVELQVVVERDHHVPDGVVRADAERVADLRETARDPPYARARPSNALKRSLGEVRGPSSIDDVRQHPRHGVFHRRSSARLPSGRVSPAAAIVMRSL